MGRQPCRQEGRRGARGWEARPRLSTHQTPSPRCWKDMKGARGQAYRLSPPKANGVKIRGGRLVILHISETNYSRESCLFTTFHVLLVPASKKPSQKYQRASFQLPEAAAGRGSELVTRRPPGARAQKGGGEEIIGGGGCRLLVCFFLLKKRKRQGEADRSWPWGLRRARTSPPQPGFTCDSF